MLVEEAVGALADDSFSPVFLRNATVYGASPRQRFDLVVNDLAATAYLYKEIRMTSDGTPWRPFVHILDIAAAVSCVLDAPREVVHGEIFNVGSSSSNYQIRQIAEIVGELVPGMRGLASATRAPTSATTGSTSPRSRRRLPGFSCQWDVERGVAELLDVFARIGLDEPTYRWRGYTRLDQIRHLLDTGQIDDDLFWTSTGVTRA